MLNIWILLTVTFSSLIKGLTGFGFALVSLPILLHWYAPKEIIPVLMICNFIASVFIILQKKEKKLIDSHALVLISSGGICSVLGVAILAKATGGMLIRFSGIAFILLTLLSLRQPKKNRTSLPQYLYIAVGAIIGIITGAISISGPPLALFLNKANVKKEEFREIFAWFSIVTSIITIVGYAFTSLLTLQVVQLTLIFSPILLLGTVIGKRLNGVIPSHSFKAINIGLTLVSCLLLILK